MRVPKNPIFHFCRLVPMLGAALVAGVLVLGVQRAALAIETNATHAILVDYTTGTALFEKNPDQPMPPASMSKLMTVYIVFEELKLGRLSLQDTFRVSEKAWRKGGSKMFVEVDTRVSVEDLLRGVIIQSGNDACIVLAEGIAGTEETFADRMNEKARELGLQNSHFTNSTGWPDPNQNMSPRDLAILSYRLIEKFPDYYTYFAELEFTFSGVRQGNRNPLLYKNLGADGLKTGHTEASGYGLAASAVREDRRLILILNGLTSVNERSQEAERLLEYGFREFDNYLLFRAGELVAEADVWLGAAETVPLLIETDILITLARSARADLRVAVAYEGPIAAPIERGAPLATLSVSAPGMRTIEAELVAGAAVDELSTFARIGAAINYLLWGPKGH